MTGGGRGEVGGGGEEGGGREGVVCVWEGGRRGGRGEMWEGGCRRKWRQKRQKVRQKRFSHPVFRKCDRSCYRQKVALGPWLEI